MVLAIVCSVDHDQPACNHASRASVFITLSLKPWLLIMQVCSGHKGQIYSICSTLRVNILSFTVYLSWFQTTRSWTGITLENILSCARMSFGNKITCGSPRTSTASLQRAVHVLFDTSTTTSCSWKMKYCRFDISST